MVYARTIGPLVASGMLLLSLSVTSCNPKETNEEVPAVTAAPNTLTEAEVQEGWRLLFDGEDFAGWRGLGREDVPAELWQVVDGAIRKVPTSEVPVQADGQPLAGCDLMTEETFADFEFAFEFRIGEADNSGVKYNVSEDMSTSNDPPNAALGFEYQVLGPNHPDASERYPLRVAGALYDLAGPDGDHLRSAGEWNEGRIVFHGNHGEHWLNGVKVLEYDLASPEFAQALAASKYAPIEGFADRRIGHIVLQDHSDEVWYRNLKIRVLPGS